MSVFCNQGIVKIFGKKNRFEIVFRYEVVCQGKFCFATYLVVERRIKSNLIINSDYPHKTSTVMLAAQWLHIICLLQV